MNHKTYCHRPGLGRALATLLIFAGLPFLGGQSAAAAPEKKSETNSIATVTRGALKGKVQLEAVFEAADMRPLKLEPHVWADLTVLEAVPHGKAVRKGDLLVKLETEKIEEQIKDMEQDRPAGAVGLELAAAEFENLQKATPLKLEASRRSQRLADEDYDYFVTTSRVQKEKVARFGVKAAEQRLEGVNEELAQLEKMYKADDLTEETEEIILKRQRFAVEASQYSLESSRLAADRDLKTGVPREHEALRAQKRDQELALALAEETLPKALTKKQLEFDKLQREQKKAEKKLADLKKDLKSLVVRAPMDGIVYYGACDNGRWSTGGAVSKKLVPTGKLSPNEVFMTIVNPEKLILRTVVPESDLSNVRAGLEGNASPVSAPDKKLPVKIEQISYVPLPGGGFEAKLSLQRDDSVRLMPGMNCKLSFGEGKAGALLVPKEGVFGEGEQRYVFLATNDGKNEKRTVKIGESDAKAIEIAEGLAEGDKILLRKPE